MRKTLLALAIGLLPLLSCSNNDDDDQPSTRAIPLSGTFETVSVMQGPPQGTPPVQRQRVTGTGQVSHLGRSTFEVAASITIAPPPPFANVGTSTMVAENGDQLYSTYTGTVTPQPDGSRLVVVRHTITGGTGRFQNASGFYDGRSLAITSAPTNVLTIEGELSY